MVFYWTRDASAAAGGRVIIVEHRGDIFVGERISRIGYEETCLSNSTITGNDALERLSTRGSHSCGISWFKIGEVGEIGRRGCFV